jgi:hypothetical protein
MSEEFETTEQDLSAQDVQSALAGEGEGEDLAFVVAEPRKQISRSTVIMFAVFMLAGGGFWYMHKRAGGPASAEAAASPDATRATQTINQFLAGTGSSNMRSMQAMLRDTEKVVQQFLAYPSVTQIPLTDLKTNPFRFAKTTGSSDDDAVKRQREEARQAALKAVQGLQLQSVMSGEHRACMINNSLYREGQQVEGFTIEKIATSSVIVKSGVFRFELKMQK